jgi:hypothetical protein
LWPTWGAAVIAGTVVTSGASAFGAVKELIAVNTITTEFWACSVDFDTTTNAQLFRVEVGTGVTGTFTTSRAQFQLDPTAATANQSRYMVGAYPAWCPANTQMVARATGTGAKVIGVSLCTATGL